MLIAVATLTRREGPGPAWISAGSLEDIRGAGVVYLADARVFVVAEESEIIALSAQVPHIPGERVLFCPSSGWFESPFHGEKFDRFGNYAIGPAARGLDRVAVQVLDGTVWVNPAQITLGPPRGSSEPEDPRGPFCMHGEAKPGFASWTTWRLLGRTSPNRRASIPFLAGPVTVAPARKQHSPGPSQDRSGLVQLREPFFGSREPPPGRHRGPNTQARPSDQTHRDHA